MSRFVPYTPHQRALVAFIALSSAPLAHAQEVEKSGKPSRPTARR